MKKISIDSFLLVLIPILIVGTGFYFACPNFVEHPLYLFLKDFVTLGIAFAGVIVASGGLVTWRNKIEYTKTQEVVEGVSKSLLKLRDAIKYVRNPAIFPSESGDAAKQLKQRNPEISDMELQKDAHTYVYELRWKKIQDALTEVDSNLLMTELLWGREIYVLMVPLRKKITDLNIALKQNFQPEYRTMDPMKIFDIIYDQSDWVNDREDAFGTEVNTQISKIQEYLRSKLPRG